MNANFTKIVNKLKTDPLTAISVFNEDTFSFEIRKFYGKNLISKFGSIENFFEQLKTKGVSKISIQELRKNGTSAKKIEKPFSVFFSDKEEKQLQPVAISNNQTQPVATNNNQMQGIGLGYAEQINLFADQRDKVRFELDNAYLKTENERLTNERNELKEQILADKYALDKKANTTETVTTLLQTFAPMLQGMFQQNAPASLNAPAVQLSEVKNHVYQILQSGQFSDEMAKVLISVIEKINVQENFYPQLLELINGKKNE